MFEVHLFRKEQPNYVKNKMSMREADKYFISQDDHVKFSYKQTCNPGQVTKTCDGAHFNTFKCIQRQGTTNYDYISW